MSEEQAEYVVNGRSTRAPFECEVCGGKHPALQQARDCKRECDVNLLDVLEHIVDGVMAGLARSGTYRPSEVSPELLKRAFDNTVQLLLENVEVDE